MSHFFLFLLSLPALIDALNKGELRKSFGKYYPGGEDELAKAILHRHLWSGLEVYDRMKGDTSNPQNKHQFNSLGQVIQCPKDLLHSYGEQQNGQHHSVKKICHDFSPVTAETPPCHIIKFEQSLTWEFELELLIKSPSCHVHVIDCAGTKTTEEIIASVPQEIQALVHVHQICIGNQDKIIKQKQYFTWNTFAEKINMNFAPILLKMDIEGFEWSILRDLMKYSPIALLPQTVSLRLYTMTTHRELNWSNRLRDVTEISLFAEQMMKYGYFLVDRDDTVNGAKCTHCSDVIFSRIGETAVHRGIHQVNAL